jgi:hypothetical protein
MGRRRGGLGVRIQVRVQGGFAGIRRPPVLLETSELEPETARELEELAAGLPAGGAPPTRGADLMRYEVTVDDASGHRTAVYHEPDVPEQVRTLLRLARETGRGA